MASGLGLSTEYNSQKSTTRSAFGTDWGMSNNIWTPPSAIGAGKRDNTRPGSRPPPLSNGGLNSDGLSHANESPSPEQITGSSSLLNSSEGEGWSQRWRPGAPSAAINGLRGRQLNQAATSPVRNRTNQHTRESSPFYPPQIQAIGASLANRTGSSMLDPTITSFAPRNGSNVFESGFSPRSETEDTSRRQLNGLSFGNTFDTSANSGYASSAASRNGSLPPSRHGMEPPSNQFGDLTLSNAIMHRANQHSRNSNISTSNQHTGAVSNYAWQSIMGDLSSNPGRTELNRQMQDRPGSSYWDPSRQMSPPGSVNGMSSTNYERSGSLSFEPGTNLLNPSLPGYGSQRSAHGQEYSPTGSDSRRGRESPIYQFNQNQPSQDWRGGIQSHNSRTNLSDYSGYSPVDSQQLHRALHQVVDSQSYQPSPSLSHRSLYSTGPNLTGSSTPNYRGAMPPFPAPQTHGGPYGQSLQSARWAPRGPAAEAAEKNRSPLLQEFHVAKGNKHLELRQIYSHIAEFSGDQHGSRFLQNKLETANSDERAQVFAEILPNAVQLMLDIFGNYVIQKLFTHGNQQQKKQLADKMKGNMLTLSMQVYGCRVVQKALEVLLVDQQASLIQELNGKVIQCVKDQHGNHVIQKAIESIPLQHIRFITAAFTGQVRPLATHNYGCRVIQRMLESSHEPEKTEILQELQTCVQSLAVDQFGNYVTQTIIKHGRPGDRDRVIAIVTNNLVSYATEKFASNVVEKAFIHSNQEQRQKILGVAASIDSAGESTLCRLMRDSYANYIIQLFLKHLRELPKGEEYDDFVAMLEPQLERLKKISYGKQLRQIEQLIEKPRPAHWTSTPPLDEDAPSPRSSSHPSTSEITTDDGDAPNVNGMPDKTPSSRIEVLN